MCSLDLLQVVGFKLENEYLIPDMVSEARLNHIKEELILMLDGLRSEVGIAAVPISTMEKEIKVALASVSPVFGIVSSLENSVSVTNEYLAQAYRYFGLCYGASDQLVSWTYSTLTDKENLLDIREAVDHLTRIANITQSEVLQTLVVCEKSMGKLGYNDIGDAYAYFNISQEDNIDDRLLIGLYQVKMSDEPAEKNMHQDKLKAIAIARNSMELIEFLKAEKGITSLTSLETIQQIMGGKKKKAYIIIYYVFSCLSSAPTYAYISCLIRVSIQQKRGREMNTDVININRPVGLNNIGNTCYFNSLLQVRGVKMY